MARIRSLKPSFFKDEALCDLTPVHRLLFQGLWCLADKHGHLEDRPRLIKIEVLPYDDCDVVALLSDLARAGLVVPYQVRGRRYLAVKNFRKHQRVSGAEAKAPTPIPTPEERDTPEISVIAPENTNEAHRKHIGSTLEALETHTRSTRDEEIRLEGITEYGVTEYGGRDTEYSAPDNVAHFPALPDPPPVPRDAWLSLVEVWNAACRTEPAWTPVQTHLQRASQTRLLQALRAMPDLSVWEARFRRAAQSDHLTNRNGKGFVSTLWWLIEHVDQLDAGQYDERLKAPMAVTEKPDPYAKDAWDDWVPAKLRAVTAGTAS